MSLLHLTAVLGAALFALPCVVLALECLAACLPPRPRREPLVKVPRTVVLVPAHDEEDGIPGALRSIQADLDEDDEVLVVAHNCSDRTAMISRALGAHVVEARDDGSLGKPAALLAGLAHLASDPPDVVVIVDADCRVEPGAIRLLARAAATSGGPVQGDYRFSAESDGPRSDGSGSGGSGSDAEFGSLSSLAILVKNFVRPLGLTRLGLPCLLNGAGSAYPFEQLRSVPHGKGSIAEDYQLAIDLAERGHPTRFVPEARVRSVLPERRESALKQRRRWEHGHLALVLGTAPALILRGLLRFDRVRLSLGLDLLVPPLAFLLAAFVPCAVLAGALWALEGERAPLWVLLAAGLGAVASLAAAIARFAGRRTLARAAWHAPVYVLRKLPLYLGFLLRRETRWRKTERASSRAAAAPDEGSRERTGTGQ